MESTYELQGLDQSALQNLLNNSNTSLIPESLVTTLIVSFVILNILGLLFVVFYIAGIVRKWKVQTAILNMQKDVAEIRLHLGVEPATTPVAVPEPAPSGPNRVIAATDNSPADDSPTTPNNK